MHPNPSTPTCSRRASGTVCSKSTDDQEARVCPSARGYNPTHGFRNLIPLSIVIFFPRPTFNADSATNHNSDLDEAEGKQFLQVLYFDPD
ncbi:hypothetical protein EVAR_6640_1 [Eumeta japonica]|uniref:Uncharacterized protein n=1 Tax=Eumeta variegata TaxID=151549 RepID=A0A4C1TKG5_EUMVA|nr:hypothetical protein EVAR_6640_1 [Eumeta japonica]